MNRRSFPRLLTVCALALPLLAGAQTPTKPLRLVVPFPAGGATDLLARSLAQRLGQGLGTTVVVENRAGAGGTLGSAEVAKAAPDGNTLLLSTSSTHAIGSHLNTNLPYKALGPDMDFTPIAHVASEAFKAQAGLFITHIPYRGTALSIPDLVSGKVHLLFDSVVSGMPHVKDGKLKALAVTSATRSALAPELPTVAESGLPGFVSSTWFGIYAPKGLPADMSARLNAEINAALKSVDVQERFARLGAEPAPANTPAQFAAMVAADSARWASIIKDRKITIE